jgi:aminoglycoside 6-adenylyltransferase
MKTETEMLDFFVRWGNARPEVRALVLTSTRTVPGADVDRLSDYDLIVAVSDPPGIQPYFESRLWLEDFGHVLVLYRDPIRPWFPPGSIPTGADSLVERCFAYITQYEEDGLKIDFTLMPVALLQRIAAAPLEPDLDLGYRVLLDKDGLTAGMAPPTHRAFIPTPPSQTEYLEAVELFFHECTYLAKYIWRGDLLPARSHLEDAIKNDELRRVLEWHAEIEAGWSLRLKAHGRGLQKVVRPEIWAELEATYAGDAQPEASWTAMWRTVALFEKVARSVGAALGYPYPDEMHRRSVAYLRWVQALPPYPG